MDYKIAYNITIGCIAILLVYAILTGLSLSEYSIMMAIFIVLIGIIPKEDDESDGNI